MNLSRHGRNQWAKSFCPILGQFRAGYHWSFMQVELHPRRTKQGRSLALAFATDVIFRRQADFQPLYQAIAYGRPGHQGR